MNFMNDMKIKSSLHTPFQVSRAVSAYVYGLPESLPKFMVSRAFCLSLCSAGDFAYGYGLPGSLPKFMVSRAVCLSLWPPG